MTPQLLVPAVSPSAVVNASAAAVLLLVASVLSVYKPTGITRYGQRKQQVERTR